MTKRHDDVFNAVLSGIPEKGRAKTEKDKGGARFLKRGNAISDRLSGDLEEKTLQWVDPSDCTMWVRHNRNYDLLTPENCSDLIEGIKSQGRQEFPAVVRRLRGEDYKYEVICGARRHFAIKWLQANNYPQFKYLIEVRDLSDEEAFRLADIENRDREDISDYERAIDYADAVKHYYDGKQKAMASRLEVSEVWLSRYLELARLPDEIMLAYATVRDIREVHARALKPLLKSPQARALVIEKANEIALQQSNARAGQGAFIDGQKVIALLKASAAAPAKKKAAKRTLTSPGGAKIQVQRKAKSFVVELPQGISRTDAEAALAKVLDQEL